MLRHCSIKSKRVADHYIVNKNDNKSKKLTPLIVIHGMNVCLGFKTVVLAAIWQKRNKGIYGICMHFIQFKTLSKKSEVKLNI